MLCVYVCLRVLDMWFGVRDLLVVFAPRVFVCFSRLSSLRLCHEAIELLGAPTLYQ